MAELTLPHVVAAQVDEHLRIAVGLAMAGKATEAAGEAALARMLMRLSGTADLPRLTDLPRMADLTDDQRRRLKQTTCALALDFEAHFVSEGQHELANMYEAIAAEIDRALESDSF